MATQALRTDPIENNDNTATSRGFTRAVVAECDEATLYLLIRPDEDLDSRFRAFDTDNQEWLMVNGWMFYNIEDDSADEA